ncbi:FAD dependent oxidoreductase [Chytriomyces sp. MP71]|nr:FAD dependent oxidoreductase [Chytriomyces sp. MP71]
MLKSPRLAKHPLQSHWLQDLPTSTLPPPPSDQREFDVIIVGGGISGFSTALHLTRLQGDTRKRLTIAVLDARDVAGGATGRNGGLLVPRTTESFEKLAKAHGDKDAMRLAAFDRDNADALVAFVQEQAEYGFTMAGTLEPFGMGAVVGFESHEQAVEMETAARDWNKRMNSSGSYAVLDPEELKEMTGCMDLDAVSSKEGGICFSDQYRVHPARLTLAIARAALSDANACFFPHCNVLKVTKVTAQKATSFVLSTSLGTFTSHSQIVYATNAWTSALLPTVPITPIRNQVICTAPVVPNSAAAKGWCEGQFGLAFNDGYEYISGRGDGRIVFGGMRFLAPDMDVGCDRDDVLDERVSQALREYLPSKFACLSKKGEPFSVDREWAGIMGWTPDHLPFVGSLGQVPGFFEEEMIIAGFSGHGMSRCFLSGKAVAEMILGLKVSANFPRCFLPTGQRLIPSNNFKSKC